MGHPDPTNPSKRSLQRSSSSHISMSDAESTTSQADSWHSPLPSESPLRSHNPSFQPERNHSRNKSSKSFVSVDKYYSPLSSPGVSNFPASSPPAGASTWRRWTHSDDRDFSVKENSPVVLGLHRLVRDDPPPPSSSVKDVGGERQSRAAVVSKAALFFRGFEVVVCLISFLVMAADKSQGWTGDSYDRYKEYRYCVAVNVMGFVYSGFQAYAVAYHLGTGKHVIPDSLVHYRFDFSMDQFLSYLVLSASSSAATRTAEWISNWGKDSFTSMASASIAMSFLAFIAFAFSSLVSGYNLCNHTLT